ncbi:biopolymer transport protein ExbB [Panacagrimonas perspica]|uniref:Biopolymer transport protein ExbB n=1 Tax=Panacagrimonas perspica TaxID=381431 RepID=A0A4R7PCZ7_9GAMM|nr:MotA/TolQ/ExbB proton channel family protein [Panacagrimonas perspica]TDU32025.1 biopolymer transport protein ExbB [Panacagrimonas perspica]THD04443.1 hypothetical protein B1810_05405 [Panacagrimonas perspica]
MEFFGGILRFFQNGGIFMFPIAATAAFGIAVTVERWLYLKRTIAKNTALWQRVAPQLIDGNLDGADRSAQGSEAALAGLLRYGIGRIRQGWPRDDLQRSLDGSVADTISMVEKRTHYLSMLANVATLLGLLGTIMGLVHAFAAVGQVSAAEKAGLLSSSISEALNCTAFGLLVAIPLMVVHSFLQSRSSEIVDILDSASSKLLDAAAERSLSTGKVPGTAAPRAADESGAATLVPA